MNKLNKYAFESNINFYEEINKKVSDTDTKYDNICLITYEELLNIYDTLECGHSFNHIPLLKELMTHQKKYNNPTKYKIKCPMCKSIHPYLLPLHIDDIKLVNINCESLEDEYNQFIELSDKDNPFMSTECTSMILNGKNKGNKCNVKKIYKENLCKRHYNVYYKNS